MGVSHGFSELPDKREALIESKVCKLRAQEAVKTNCVRVVLKDESWAEFRFPVVEDALNAWMFDAFKNTGFALCCPGEAVTSFGGGSAGVWIDLHAARNTGSCVAGREVLPVFPFPEELPQFVVADTATAARGADTCLLDRPQYDSGCREVERAPPPRPELISAEENPDNAAVSRLAGPPP